MDAPKRQMRNCDECGDLDYLRYCMDCDRDLCPSCYGPSGGQCRDCADREWTAEDDFDYDKEG